MRRLASGMLLLTCAAALQAADGGLSEQQAQGKSVFEVRCGMCHQLPEPDMLKPAQWKRSLQTMQKRMRQADMPPLDETEFEQVFAYLSSQAR